MCLLGSKVCFWKRYVDDVFLFAKHEDLNEIIQIANSICQAIQFIVEIETDRKLPSLDVIVEKLENFDFQEVLTSVNRKATNSGQYQHFELVKPLFDKVEVVRNLIHRAEIYFKTNAAFRFEKKRYLLTEFKMVIL